MLKKLFIGLSFLILSSTLFSQTMKVTGTVYDTTGIIPLEKVSVIAVRLKDSLLLGYTRTNKNGFFELSGFPPDTFDLMIEYPGLDEKSYYIFGNDGNNEIDIPSVKLNPKSQDLDEVVIFANKNPIFFRGDTLVYVADSFKVSDNAVVEDLLKKLPGISVDENGAMTSQGQDIEQVLVDGDEFFGSDPTIATKNLGALGEAGAITTNDKNLHQKIESLRNYGRSPFDGAINHYCGVNRRGDELQAAFLLKKLVFVIFEDFFLSIMCINLVVRTFVFPEPAPATIKFGPSVCSTASFCSLFKLSINLSILFILRKFHLYTTYNNKKNDKKIFQNYSQQEF